MKNVVSTTRPSFGRMNLVLQENTASTAKRQKDPTITESLKAMRFQIFGRKAPRSITSQKTLKYSANSVSSGTN